MEDGLGDGVERGEDVAAGTCVGFEAEEGDGAIVEEILEVLDRGGIREVALVVLKDDGEAVDGAVVEAEVSLEALEGLQVVALAVHLRVGDENDAVGLAQDELERGVVGDLTGDGVELEGGLVSGDGIGFDGEEVEEEGAILGGGEGDKVRAAPWIEFGVDLLDIGGLAAEGGATVHDLKGDCFVVVMDAGHVNLSSRFAVLSSRLGERWWG